MSSPPPPSPGGPPLGPPSLAAPSDASTALTGSPPGVDRAPSTAVPRWSSPADPSGPEAPRSALLLTGGILSVALASLTTLVALVLLALGNALDGAVTGLGADVDGSLAGMGAAVRIVAALVGGLGLLGIVAGIGAILRRRWGRIGAIVYGSINLALALLAVVASASDGAGVGGGSLFLLAVSAAIVGFCVRGPASR